MTTGKILSLKKLLRRIKKHRKDGQEIVFTNGTFDLLHSGHVSYLEKAKSLGDILIIGVNSDRSVKTYKSPHRPLNPEKDRLRVLAALQCVDYLVLFHESTPRQIIIKIRPDFIVKGADWPLHQIAGASEIREWGGSVRRIPLVRGKSTTSLLKRIRKQKSV